MLASYILHLVWSWLASTGINLALIIMLALLIPRAGRFAERVVKESVTYSQDEDESKSSLAFAGVGIYVAQIILYFVLTLAFLQQIGFSLAGAAIPATVVSAAVGFGAQSIIADFLAGFFVLSEKQYGVGDWVRFEGSGVKVEGTVISITMRATTIRTLAEETVTIPNSVARVCINASNYWSRAVVVMQVPLLGSRSPQEAAERAEQATRRALLAPDIAAELRDELIVQPATAVNPPTTVGMPWTVDMRFMIQVTAGSQWMVERAVRLAILEEFWEEYGSATTATGHVRETITRPAPTQQFHAVAPPPRAESNNSGRHRAEEDPAAAPEALQAPKPDTTPVPWHRAIVSSLRQVRTSTVWLLLTFAALLLVRILVISVEVEDGRQISGILAPPVFGLTTVEPTESTVESSEPVTSPTPEPQPSPEPVPPTTPASTPAPTTPNSSEAPPADAEPTRDSLTSTTTTPASPLPF
ncbi:mechanosensitive ion channel family protein [Corynebacterium uterequi]|uniref:Small-conductance mechanosensitive channel n=1 Tax=Corynebacterium uterequi TaxID=1072256 RepID=A0A0G3HG66_9CORY|nr:mechanosensitive ion channel family protein [Corynebacterium uterequi]AKK10948.1 small-conductance mechanosensitive channel [Corynebacterium uterequi]